MFLCVPAPHLDGTRACDHCKLGVTLPVCLHAQSHISKSSTQKMLAVNTYILAARLAL